MAKLPQPVTQVSFAGGQRDRDHPSLIGENQFARMKDGIIRDAGLVKTRLGRTRRVTSPGGTPQAGFYFEPTPGNGFIVQINQGAFWTWGNSGSLWSRLDAATTLTNTSTACDMVALNSVLYAACGSSDNVRSWDGSSPTLTDEGNTNGDAPRGTILCEQAGRIGVSGVSSSGDYIYFSDIFDGHTFARSTDHKRIPTPGSEPVRAAVKYRKEELLAMTRNSAHLYSIPGSDLTAWVRNTIDPRVGTIAKWSVVVVGEDAFFLDSECQLRTIKRTIQDIAFGVSVPISYGNPNLFGRINKTYAYKSAACVFDNYLLLAAPLDNSTVNSSVIAFDLLHQVQTPEGAIPACLGEWRNIAAHQWIIGNFSGIQKLYYIDSKDGSLYEMFSGESDDGDEINLEVNFRAFDWGVPQNDKTAHSGEVQVMDSIGTLVLSFAKDDAVNNSLASSVLDSSNPTLPISLPFTLGTGGVTKAIPNSFYRQGRSRYWQPRITHSGGVLNLKQLTLRGWIEGMKTR